MRPGLKSIQSNFHDSGVLDFSIRASECFIGVNENHMLGMWFSSFPLEIKGSVSIIQLIAELYIETISHNVIFFKAFLGCNSASINFIFNALEAPYHQN